MSLLKDSQAAPETQADNSDVAQTAVDPVMAEQNNHNVVINTESASGSPLVDTAANHDITTAAGNSDIPNSSSTTNNALESAKARNTAATDANSVIELGSNKVEVGKSAAEPSAGNVATPPASVPANTTTITTGGEKVEGVSEDPLGSGVHSGDAVADGLKLETSADPSVHSDTDTSKADAAEEPKDGNRHVRSASVKKPVSFSKVNASKSYLAKSTTPTLIVPKPGEKVTAPASAPSAFALKPRLIAKTGASVGQKLRPTTESPSGPDASKVWNKNRPVAPPPPKQFTDEELKQQYGIHLATRLQTDENGKDPKWADIDDEDDEWVPDQVVWMDGTKSTLAPAELVPAQKEEAAPIVQPAKPVEATRPVLTLLKKQTEPTGPPKTILRPGAAHAAKSNGALATSSADKQTLKVKDGAGPPVKSPWAALPPVDNTSIINLPVQRQMPQAPAFASQDARAYEQHAPPSQHIQPAREIAADTFERGETGQQRELFNSANGRYEPAPEGRRGSMRSEAYARKPALLQRSSQTTGGPAEPSPAFQTRSGSQTEGPPSWGRRRNSSISQASGPPGRRTSINKSHEPVFLPERRTSTVVSSDMTSPVPPRNEPPPSAFAGQNAWQNQMPPPPRPEQAAESQVPTISQEQVMREKAQRYEEKRRLKKEEEEREEAAKKERLAAKLASLGGVGLSRKEREEAKEREAASERQNPPTSTVTEKQNEAEKAAVAVPALEAQISPPPPSVVAPQPAAQANPTSATTPEIVQLKEPETPIANVPSVEQPQHVAPRNNLSPAVNARGPFQQNASSPYRAPPSAFSSSAEHKQQPFGRSPLQNSDAFASPWSSSGSNVWGSSGIGNGTFDSKSPFAAMSMSSQALPMPRPATSTHASAHASPQGLGQDMRSPSMQQPPAPEQLRPIGPPGLESRADHFMSQPRGNGMSPTPGMGRQQHVPGPIAPPSRAQQTQQPQAQSQRPDERANKWMAASKDLPSRYANDARAAESKPAKDSTPEVRHDTFRETFKQTFVDGPGGKRKVAATRFTVHDGEGSHTITNALAPAPPSTQTQPAAPISTASPSNPQASDSTVRLPERKAVVPPHLRNKQTSANAAVNPKLQATPLPPQSGAHELSPPPPETVGHPVFDGNTVHPRVHLPSPRIVVRLPSAQAPSWDSSNTVVTMPQRHNQQSQWGAIGQGAGSLPLVKSEAWQMRFNGLFGRTSVHTEAPPSPPKTPPKMQHAALAVASETKVEMPEAPGLISATVSLPQVQAKKGTSPEGFTLDDSSAVTSKDTIESSGIFSEELSFGSKPRTRVPRGLSYSEVGLDPKANMLSMATNSRMNKPIEAQTLQSFNPENFERSEVGCFVNMPGVRTKHNPIYWKGGRGKPKNARPTTKHQKGKASAGPSLPKDSAPASPAATASGTPAAGSRKTSYQAASQAQSLPATGSNSSPAPAATGGRRAFKAPRGPRQVSNAAPVKAT